MHNKSLPLNSLRLKSPAELTAIVEDFICDRPAVSSGRKKDNILIIQGPPGHLKSETVKLFAPDKEKLQELHGEVDEKKLGSILIKSNTTHIQLYLDMFHHCAEPESVKTALTAMKAGWVDTEVFNTLEARDFVPIPGVLIDDCSRIHTDRQMMDYMLDVANTLPIRRPTYNTKTHMLSQVGWETSFAFRGWVIVLTNSALDQSKLFAPFADRGTLVTLDYSNLTLHEHWDTIRPRGEDKDRIYKWVGDNLHHFMSMSVRMYQTIQGRLRWPNWEELTLRQFSQPDPESSYSERCFQAMKFCMTSPQHEDKRRDGIATNELKSIWDGLRGPSPYSRNRVKDIDRSSSFARWHQKWVEEGSPGLAAAAPAPVQAVDPATPQEQAEQADETPAPPPATPEPIIAQEPRVEPAIVLDAPAQAEPIVQADETAIPPEQAEPILDAPAIEAKFAQEQSEPIVQADEPATPPEQVVEKPQWVHAAIDRQRVMDADPALIGMTWSKNHPRNLKTEGKAAIWLTQYHRALDEIESLGSLTKWYREGTRHVVAWVRHELRAQYEKSAYKPTLKQARKKLKAAAKLAAVETPAFAVSPATPEPPYFGLDPELVAPKRLVSWKSTLVQITQEVAKAGSFQAWESDPENRALVEWYVIQLVKQEKKCKLLASKKSGEPAIT